MSGEVFVLLRYLAAAGNKDYAFCQSAAELEVLVANVPIGMALWVFRQRQLAIGYMAMNIWLSRPISFLQRRVASALGGLDPHRIAKSPTM